MEASAESSVTDSLPIDTSDNAVVSSTSPNNLQAPASPSPSAEDDENARAAVALAAVAAAATANNRSPSAAAETARTVAQGMGITPPASEKKKVQIVGLSTLKKYLREKLGHSTEEVGSVILDKLANGENDAFLQQLLLLGYVRATDAEQEGGIPDLPLTENDKNHMYEENRVKIAASKLESVLGVVESAYDAISAMLPVLPSSDHPSFENCTDGVDSDAPVVVPDLLPACTSKPGDPTVEFFRECLGTGVSDETLALDKEVVRRKSTSDIEEFVEDSKGTPKKSAAHGKGGGPTMFSSMFASSKSANNASGRHHSRSPTRKGLGSVFRKKGSKHSSADASERVKSGGSTRNGEYIVRIDREMLGLTVENVLERTVVRTVLAGGPAKKAGAKVGSLIVKVGNVETKNFTHFETIDELRQSQRPLTLELRQISDEALRAAREEMGRLIRGGGFGTVMDGEPPPDTIALNSGAAQGESEPKKAAKPFLGMEPTIDAYTKLLRTRWVEAVGEIKSKKDASIARVGEKLLWILTLFIVGLERESAKLVALSGSGTSVESSPRRSSQRQYHHGAKDYADAAKSVSKVLLDFVKKKLDPSTLTAPQTTTASVPADANAAARKLRRLPPPPPSGAPPPGTSPPGHGGRIPASGGKRAPVVPGMQGFQVPLQQPVVHDEKPLLQLGDVLHRTRTFLADPASPPAAMLRGEVIAFLCDLLDVDTEMELSEDEAVSATAGGDAGPINDLGSAGSLLKLIVLNCSVMRSPDCDQTASTTDAELAEELKRRFGANSNVSEVDIHRLHAGNRFLAVVHRLAASRSTSARITACSLGPVLWGYLDFPHQLQLRGVITRALHDVEVSVRKATATVLHEIAELVFDPRAVPWLVLMCERAMTDPEPQLRSAAMTLTWHLAEHLPNAFLGDASQGSRFLRRLPLRSDPIFADVYLLQCKLLPVATRLAEDRAPAVRLAVAAQCDRLCDALGEHWASVIIDVLLALLTDSDERVRSEAVLCAPRLAEIVLLAPGQPGAQVGVLDTLLPVSIRLQKDPSAAVRAALATAAGELLTLLVGLQSLEETSTRPTSEAGSGETEGVGGVKQLKKHVDDTLIPLVQKLLHDSDPEVTSAALRAVTNASRGTVREIRARRQSTTSEDDSVSISSHTSREKQEPVFIPVLSEAQVLRLLPTLSELANSRQWRVRQSAVEIVPALLGCTHKFETRAEISTLCVRLMDDSVDAVRKTAAECLCLGGGSLGSHGERVSGEWITAIVIPHLRSRASHPDSKQRLLSLKMVEVILQNGACPPKWFHTHADAGASRRAGSPLREMAEITLSLANDRIANVRLNVGRVLASVLYLFEEDELTLIRDVLEHQIETEKARADGGDRDVLYFSRKCLHRARLRLDDEPQTNADSQRLTL